MPRISLFTSCHTAIAWSDSSRKLSVAGKGEKPSPSRKAFCTQSKAMKEDAWPKSEKITPVILFPTIRHNRR